jgi:hypothetical protein
MTPKLLVLAALAGTVPLAFPNRNAVPVPKSRTEFEEYWDSARQQGKRRNGARITATVEKQTAELLVIRWSIDYEGPRSPLVILTPTLDNGKSLMRWQAGFRFNAEGSDGKVYQQYFTSAPRTPDGKVMLMMTEYRDKSEYLIIPKDKPASGTAEAPFKLAEAYKRDFPKAMTSAPKNLFVQFYHGPYDRAEQLGVDAWTGNLITEPIRLEPKGW